MSGNPVVSRRQAIELALGAFAVAVLPRSLSARLPDPFPHPEPRPGITGAGVLAEVDLGPSKSVRAAYAAAREHPAVFDGLYCVCECDQDMGHRSLLACFESRQAVGCWSCREQAELVVELLGKDQSLAQIREAFDRKWGKQRTGTRGH